MAGYLAAMPQSGIEIVRSAIAALNRGDIDGVLGEDVLYVGSAHFEGRGSGAQVAARAALLWTVRDGKITRFRFFQSKEDALAVVEAEAAADVP
jgi:hypothetical protein